MGHCRDTLSCAEVKQQVKGQGHCSLTFIIVNAALSDGRTQVLPSFQVGFIYLYIYIFYKSCERAQNIHFTNAISLQCRDHAANVGYYML